MDSEKTTTKCDVCGGSFQFGPDRYDVNRNQTYDIMVCINCHSANWDGWAPHLETRVIKNLVAKNLPLPSRNKKGWLPRE